MIKIENESSIKKVKKPWGEEFWIAGPHIGTSYALKRININAPYQSSIQFHEKKEETIYFLKGEGFLHYYKDKIDIKKYKSGAYSSEEIDFIINNLDSIKLYPSNCFTIKPGIVHSIEARTDLSFMESSTLELEDVFRLNDKFGRPDGHISSEHDVQ